MIKIKSRNKNILKDKLNKKLRLIALIKLILLVFLSLNIVKESIKYLKNINFQNFNSHNNKTINITSINFATKNFLTAQKINTFTALKFGKVNQTIEYSDKNISREFLEKNKEILSKKRGAGYWLWKPYFINKTLNERINDGDYLVYVDSGALYVNSVMNLISLMNQNKTDVMTFEQIFIEKMWTKRDIFITLSCDKPDYFNSPQVFGGFIVVKKTNFSTFLINQWLYYSEIKNLILDVPNVLGKPNYPGFIENRHDQSILSLLVKKYNLTRFKNPTETRFQISKNYSKSYIKKELESYPIIFYCGRNKIGLKLNETLKTERFIKINNFLLRYNDHTLQRLESQLKYLN